MPGNEKTVMLLDELAALDPAQRRKLAMELKKLSATFAEVSDGRRPHTYSVCSQPA